MNDDDTIVAIATASGPAGIGVVRLSGPAAIAIAADALGMAPAQLDRSVRLGWVRDRSGHRIDQVLAFAMRAPASFTGEDVAELQGHGGSHNLGQLLAAVVDRGARVAEPGEFTRRAVAHGKLDLLRAEALLEVIHAGSERAWRLAQHNLGGQLGEEVGRIEQRALALLAEVEGRIDFPEDDLAASDLAWLGAEIAALHVACARLATGFRHGRAISHGITVALVGPVNVGKSSLLNALVGTERALVAAQPGTTRDWLEVRDVWDGIAVTLVDTAGLRATDDPVERRGIELGEERVRAADVVLVVNDGASPWDDGARYGARALVVRSKADLAGCAEAPSPARAMSARTVAGGERAGGGGGGSSARATSARTVAGGERAGGGGGGGGSPALATPARTAAGGEGAGGGGSPARAASSGMGAGGEGAGGGGPPARATSSRMGAGGEGAGGGGSPARATSSRMGAGGEGAGGGGSPALATPARTDAGGEGAGGGGSPALATPARTDAGGEGAVVAVVGRLPWRRRRGRTLAARALAVVGRLPWRRRRGRTLAARALTVVGRLPWRRRRRRARAWPGCGTRCLRRRASPIARAASSPW